MKIINKSLEVDILKVENWKDNPRKIKPDELSRLTDEVRELGVYKPLICIHSAEESYVVIGGNMRLRALRKLGYKTVWITEIEVKDKEEMIRVALSDNDQVGTTDIKSLKDLIQGTEIDVEQYGIDLGEDSTDEKGEIEFTEKLLEEHNYIVFYFDKMLDFQVIEQYFGLKTVKSLSSKDNYEQKGVGRVLKGSELLKAIKGKT